MGLRLLHDVSILKEKFKKQSYNKIEHILYLIYFHPVLESTMTE